MQPPLALGLAVLAVLVLLGSVGWSWWRAGGAQRRQLAWLAVGVVGAGAFLYAAEDVAENDDLAEVDVAFALWVAGVVPAPLRAWSEGLAMLGSAAVMLPVVGAAALVLWTRGERRSAGQLAAVMALEAGLVALLKLAFARARPEGAILAASEGFSFPSGHTAAAATLACALVWMGMRRWRHRGLVALLVAGTLWVALMAASRVTLGVHYLSDVLGGAGVGLMVAAAVFARDRDVSPRAPGPVLPLPRGRAQG